MSFIKDADLLLRANALLAEGPVWDEKTQTLYWVDILKNSIHSLQPDSGVQEQMTLDDFPSTIALESSGALIVTARRSIYRINLKEQTKELLQTIADGETAVRFNDGKPDPEGRLWVGTMALDQSTTEKVGAGALYRFCPSREYEPVLCNTTISNGLCWRENTFYFIDTPTQCVCSYHYDSSTGNLSRPQVCVRIPQQEGGPDGMTIDRDGMLWIAQWGGSQVGCYNPQTGEKLGEVRVPDRYVSCCTFGGSQMDTLYITTAREDDPNGGNLYHIKLNTTGPFVNRCRAFSGQ